MCPIFQYIVVSQKTGLAWLVLLITCRFLKKFHTFIHSFTHICLIIQLVNLTLNKHLSVTFTKLILLHSPLWNRMKISVSSFPLQHQRAGKFSGPHWERIRRKLHEVSSKCFFGCRREYCVYALKMLQVGLGLTDLTSPWAIFLGLGRYSGAGKEGDATQSLPSRAREQTLPGEHSCWMWHRKTCEKMGNWTQADEAALWVSLCHVPSNAIERRRLILASG